MRTTTALAMSGPERAALSSLVDTMVSYGLSYTARSGTDARTGAFTSELALDPALDTLSRFEGLAEPPARRSLAPALRQVVAHECVVEQIRRADLRSSARGAAAAATAGDNTAAPQAPPPPEQTVRGFLLCIGLLRVLFDEMHPALKGRRPPGGEVQDPRGCQAGVEEAHGQARRHDARARLVPRPHLSRLDPPAVQTRPSQPPFTSSTKGAPHGSQCSAWLLVQGLTPGARAARLFASYTNAVRKVVRMHELL